MPTLEIDAQVEAPYAERDHAEQDDHTGGQEPPAPSPDEIERGLSPVETDEDVVRLFAPVLELLFLGGELDLLVEGLLELDGRLLLVGQLAHPVLAHAVVGPVAVRPVGPGRTLAPPGAHAVTPAVAPRPLAMLIDRRRCRWRCVRGGSRTDG